MFFLSLTVLKIGRLLENPSLRTYFSAEPLSIIVAVAAKLLIEIWLRMHSQESNYLQVSNLQSFPISYLSRIKRIQI